MFDRNFETYVDGKKYSLSTTGTDIRVTEEGIVRREFVFNERLRPAMQANYVSNQLVMALRFTFMDVSSVGHEKQIHLTAKTLDQREVHTDMSIQQFQSDLSRNFQPAARAIIQASESPEFPSSLKLHFEELKNLLQLNAIGRA